MNAVTYKEIFPLIRDKKIWWGYNSPTDFKRPDGSIKKTVTRWYTNLPVDKHTEEITLVKTYNPKDYQKYDNYLAFEVGKVKDIPKDDFIDIEIPDNEYDKWKATYGDNLTIIE